VHSKGGGGDGGGSGFKVKAGEEINLQITAHLQKRAHHSFWKNISSPVDEEEATRTEMFNYCKLEVPARQQTGLIKLWIDSCRMIAIKTWWRVAESCLEREGPLVRWWAWPISGKGSRDQGSLRELWF
jgi:hypothetical protein